MAYQMECLAGLPQSDTLLSSSDVRSAFSLRSLRPFPFSGPSNLHSVVRRVGERDVPLAPRSLVDSPPPRKGRHGNDIEPSPSENYEERPYLDVSEEVLASYKRLKLPVVVLPNMHQFGMDSQEEMTRQQVTEYERLMKVGSDLLREGEQGLDGRLEVGIADRMLAEASALFSSAASVVPSSSAPISALGNTFLLRGKLKFMLTEKLSEMLVEERSQPQRKNLNSRAKASSLQHSILKICKECEELLVEAGRKYHIVLSKNERDDHAMFCWGLALFFRARLVVAEDHEEAVPDAKKIYLAAVTKFQAAVALKKSYASCALLYWGLALRDQAWLYPTGSTAKLNLLRQAMEVLEDAMKTDPGHIQTKLAMASCSEELGQLSGNRA